MTDFAATPSGGFGDHALAPTASVTTSGTAAGSPRRRTGLWIGLGVGALLLVGGAVAASAILIAPGTTVAGVAVGGLTPGGAAEKIAETIEATEVTLTGAGTAATVTAGALGASVDALALAQEVHAAHPMWNIGQWNPEPIVAPLTLDPQKAEEELRTAVPEAWEDATDAAVVFDEEANAFVTTPSAPGSGVDLDALSTAIGAAVTAGEASLTAPATAIEHAPQISDETAAEMAETLNAMRETAGFYIGDERAVPVDPATFATWVEVVGENGSLRVEPNISAIQASVDTIPEHADRDPVPAKAVVSSSGTVLRSVQGGEVGREVVGLDEIAASLAESLREGSARYELQVNETAFGTTNVVRKITVNLSTQRLTMLEDGEVVDSWAISSGKAISPTHTGNYTIKWKTPQQNMRGYERVNGQKVKIDGWKGPTDSEGYAMFEQPNVKWAMYFNGNQAFHGVYWHSNWGNRMSHGCVGMPEWRAKQLYDWSPEGLEISIHN